MPTLPPHSRARASAGAPASPACPCLGRLACLAAALLLAACAAVDAAATVPFELVKHDERSQALPRHAGTYPPFAAAWVRDTRLSDVLAVFPHPILPRRVALATETGLLLSDNAGRTWKGLAQAAAKRLGRVTRVAFAPHAADTFYLSTDGQGVWASRDGGQTVRRIGSKQAGMADDSARGVWLYAADRRFLTLLAAHGDAAPGISLTEDGGRTWRVVAAGHHVWSVLPCGAHTHRLLMAASEKDAPDRRGIYSCASPGQPWYLVVRDVVPTGAAASLFGDTVYWSTADSGLYAVTHKGSDYHSIGPAGVARWASVLATWGHHADAQVLAAYDPTKLGMVVSTDDGKTWSPHSRGLYTSPFVREGAHLRANASGTVFYAVANGILCRGFRRDGPLQVRSVAVDPTTLSFGPQSYREAMSRLRAVLSTLPDQRYAAPGARRIVEFAREAREAFAQDGLAVTAAVTGRGVQPSLVSVDLSRIGGLPQTPMLDDGRHADGDAGDGVYGASVAVDPRGLERDWRDWRRPWPGLTGLTVSAVAPDGSLAAAVGCLFVYAKPESFSFWNESESPGVREPTGRVAADVVELSARPALGTRSLRIVAKGGPWTLPFGDAYRTVDVAGFYALSFWVRADAEEADELFVQLRDGPDYKVPTTTPRVAVVASRAVEGGSIGTEFRRVVLPLARFLEPAPGFLPRLQRWVIFSGGGRSARTCWIDDIRFFLTREDSEAYGRRHAK